MLNNFDKILNLCVKQLTNLQSFINAKSALYFGLVTYWGIILIGTLVQFI